MKNIILLFLFLIPVFLFAQYPATGNKSRLGYQTTGDGLIWRGVAADTAIKPRTTANAYFQLDTVNRVLRRYIATQGSWQVVGGSSASIDSLIYATRYWVGSNYFPLEGGTLTGTGGAGFIGLPSQGTAPGTPVSGLNIFAQGSSFNWKGTDGFERQITSSLTGGRNYALPDINGTFALGTGTADRSARWTGTNTLGAGSWSDNLTRLQAQVPVQFQSVTTAGLPTGVTGYTVYNSTIGGIGWYDGSRWNYVPKADRSAFTSTYIPFANSSGQLTEASVAGQNLRYYYNGVAYVFEASSALTVKGTSGVFSGNADISAFSATNNGIWAFSVNESNGSLTLYDGVSSQSTVILSKNSGNSRITTNSTTTALSAATLTAFTSPTVSAITGSNTLSAGSLMADALGNALASFRSVNGSNIFSYSPFSTSPYMGITNGTQTGYFQVTSLDGVRIGSVSNHVLTFNTSATERARFATTGNLLLGTTTDVTGYKLNIVSTGAMSLPRGTVTQRPTIVASTTPFRYNTDSTALEYGESVGTWRQLATRAYARSLVASATWLKPQLEAGSVTINAATNADLFINNLDSVKFGKTLIRSSNNGLLILNPDVGASGISTFGAGYHTVINGILNGTDGGTGHIILGGSVTANTTGTTFAMSLGYASNVNNAYGLGVGYNADVTEDNAAAFGRNSLADEVGEMSLGSDIYSKINLWTNTGDIYAKGDVIAEDSVKVTTRPNMPSATNVAVYDASGWLGYRDVSTLSNGIYSGSATLASHTTRARVPDDGNLFFSQTYNGGADSAFFYFQNAGGGERYAGFGITDTASTGGASLIFGNGGAGDLSFELKTTDALSGTARVRGLDGDLLLSSSAGNISLSTDVAAEVQVVGLVRAKQEAYYEITSTSSPQTFSNTYSDNFVNQGSTQASFTFLFPASPEDGQILSMTWNNAISTLTLDGNGNTITGTAVTTAVAGTRRQFKYYASASAWIKIY